MRFQFHHESAHVETHLKRWRGATIAAATSSTGAVYRPASRDPVTSETYPERTGPRVCQIANETVVAEIAAVARFGGESLGASMVTELGPAMKLPPKTIDDTKAEVRPG